MPTPTTTERDQPAAPFLEDGFSASPEDVLRCRTYRLLAALLARAPDTELLTLLASSKPRELGGDGLEAAWAALAAAAEQGLTRDLEREYHDLFIGLGRGELLPYGSWYLSETLMGRPLAELRQDLVKLGFERRPDVHEPEDHIAAVLEVMAALGETPAGLEAQPSFFERHLKAWGRRFFEELATAEAAAFYRAVGLLGQEFLQLEELYLDSSACT